jgi:hypothetical protein
MTGKSPKKYLKKVIKYEGILSISTSTSKIPLTFISEMFLLNKPNRMIMHKYIIIRTIQSMRKATNLFLIVARTNSFE